MFYKASNINDLELLYSVLKTKFPNNQITIEFKKKHYLVSVSLESYKNDPIVPLDVDIKVVYGDTDSTMMEIKFNRKSFELNRIDSFKLAKICGDELTSAVFKRPPIEMEFEKCFQPFILLSKKRYITKTFENLKDPFKLKGITSTGTSLTRRDYCQLVKKCYSQVIDSVMESNDVQISCNIFKEYINKIYTYDVDFQDVKLSAQLAESYKTRPVHVQLADRMRLRGEDVQIGDRLAYIFIQDTSEKRNQQKSALGETIEFALENNLKINRMCYIEQLAKPLLGFFKVILKDYPKILNETIEFTNNKLIQVGGKALKTSDYILKE